MLKYLLPVSVLCAAAAGVGDVVFGLDGDFDGAPLWHPPLACDGEWHTDYCVEQGAVWVYRGSHGNSVQCLADLDLRVPSVASRLARLCALALGCRNPGTVEVVVDYGTSDPAWSLRSARRGVPLFRWTQDGRGLGSDFPSPNLPVSVEIDGREHIECIFLSALTIALAPRIAALGAGS